MTTDFQRGSAKIYQFPTRARSPVAGNRDDAKPVTSVTPLKVANAPFDGAWYHEEAVREAELPRKN